MSEILKFVFKGSRDYVQGTSIFNAIVDSAVQKGFVEGKINLSFKHMIYSPICVLEERTSTASDSVVAKIFDNEGNTCTFCINPIASLEDCERQGFDESNVCRGAIVGDKTIIQNYPEHPDRIESLVSLCKKMHLECLDSNKKWVFARYDGLFPIPSMDKIELRITKQVGTRLTCSDVLVNNNKIADMYFS